MCIVIFLVQKQMATRILWSKNNLARSLAKSTQKKKKCLVLVDGNCFYIGIFYIFYWLCPVVEYRDIERERWHSFTEEKRERDRERRPNFTDEQCEREQEREKGGAILLMSNARESKRETERRQNFTEEQGTTGQWSREQEKIDVKLASSGKEESEKQQGKSGV